MIRSFYKEVMWHKEIDHNAAHLSWGNQFLHLISSILMLYMFYVLYRDWAIGNLDNASLIMVVSQTLRQGGHFFVEGNVSAVENKLYQGIIHCKPRQMHILMHNDYYRRMS